MNKGTDFFCLFFWHDKGILKRSEKEETKQESASFFQDANNNKAGLSIT